MPQYVFGNFFATELTVGITVGTTTLQVPPSATLDLESFVEADLKEARLTLWDGQLPPEIVGCVRNAQDGSLIVTRAQEGTTAQAWPAGTQVISSLTEEVINAALLAYFDFLQVIASAFLPLTGGVVTGPIILPAATPTDPQEATTKAYVDSVQGSGLPLSGGTMQGDINMNGNDIVNLPTPTVASNPATKAYVDAAGAFPLDTIDDFEGSLVSAGTATAYTVASNTLPGTYSNGLKLVIRFHIANGVAATLNMDGLGARPIQITPAVAAPTGMLVVGVPTSVTYDSVNSAWTIGETKGVRASELMLNQGVALTAPAADDKIGIYDESAAAPRYITLDDFFKVINVLTAETAVVAGDKLIIYDMSASAIRVVTKNDFIKAPTRTVLTVGSGTYVPPAGCRRLGVRAMGGGGGGGAAATNNGATGGATTWDISSAPKVANGGLGGLAGGNVLGGAGGSAGGGTVDFRIPGNYGGPGGNQNSSATMGSGFGGPGLFGGGPRGAVGGGGGIAGASHSGAGGAGAGTASGLLASGGGSGEYFELLVTTIAASYDWVVGAGGAGGAAGTFAGGTGGSGILIIDEYY